MEEQEELKKLKEKYIQTFDELVKKGENPWKTTEELSNVTGTTTTQVTNTILSFDEFVKNSKGEILTRKQYEKLTPLTKKIYDQIINKIK